jgi:class 3 adenylate cyclase
MVAPSIRYVTTGDGVSIAYWTMGSGPPLVILPLATGFPPSIWRAMDEMSAFNDRLAERHTVIQLDHRGTGLSGNATPPAPMEDQVADIDAVVDELGFERFAIIGQEFSSPVAVKYAVQRPDRLSHLILWCGIPSWDEYIQSPQAQTLAVIREQGDWRTYTETVCQIHLGWSEPDVARRFAAIFRDSIDQETWLASMKSSAGLDVSDVLSLISTSTLVLARQDGYYGIGGSQVLATAIPNARMVVLPGTSIAMWAGDVEAGCAEIDDFLFGQDRQRSALSGPGSIRLVLFTDVEASTALTDRFGDAKARDLLREHERLTRDALAANGGTEIKTMGDGFMASFTSASSALDAAIAMQRAIADHFEATPTPIRIRIGINAGEPIAENDDLYGTAVIQAARIMSHANGGEILVSDTVRGLVAGKPYLFSQKGAFDLKGFEEPVRLFEVRWQAED